MHEKHEVRAGQQELHIDLLKGTDSACPVLGEISDQLLGLWRVIRGERRHAGRQGMACATGLQHSTLQPRPVATAAAVPEGAALRDQRVSVLHQGTTDRKTSHTCLQTYA